MKPAVVIVVLCMVIAVGIVGCEGNAPVINTATPASPSLIPTFDIVTPSPEKTEVEPTLTKTPAFLASATFKPLVIKTLAGTAAPLIVLTQVPTLISPSPEPTIQEKYFPSALIHIVGPGDNSQLSSPIIVQASVFPGAGNLVSLQLFGEDERIMSDQLLKMVKTESGWVNLSEEIKFEIPTAGESALLVISTRDEFGRRITQSAAQIFLIQIGSSDIEPNDFTKQPFVVQSPKADAEVKGGVLYISGYAHPYNSNPIIIELLGESGGVMETRVVKLPRNPDNLNYLPFVADIPYDVDIPTPVRLTIRQRSELLLNIDIALSSQLLTLTP